MIDSEGDRVNNKSTEFLNVLSIILVLLVVIFRANGGFCKFGTEGKSNITMLGYKEEEDEG